MLDKIANLCQRLECNFSVMSDWHDGAGGVSMAYEWRIEGSKRGQSNAAGPYPTINHCLAACYEWLKLVNSRKENDGIAN